MKPSVRMFNLALVLILAISFAFTVNAQTEKKQKEEVALHHYCPVSYLAMNKAIKGDEKFSSVYKGKKYYFLNADAKKMFNAEPTKYLPKYDGYCVTALAMGKKLESDPEIFSVYKAATYLFSNKMAKDEFDKSPDMIIKNADKNLAVLSK